MLRRSVAIKLPLASIFQSQELHDRFLRECRAAAMLNHPGIVRVLESGAIQGIPYQVAEFVNGERLSDLVKRQRLSVESAEKIVRSLADAVQHAHDHGVLHRDIKSDNILLQNPVGVASDTHADSQSTENTRSSDAVLQEQARQQTPMQAALVPRITDFGLARVADDDAALSRSGMLVGTPKYMSPEQLHRDEIASLPMDFCGL
jgi:serine/threonine-protein kinase